MFEYLKVQLALLKAGSASIGEPAIHKLAEAYLTVEQREEIFGGDTDV